MSKPFEIVLMSNKTGQVTWRLPEEAIGALVVTADETVYYRKLDGNLELADKLFLSVGGDGRCVHLSEGKAIKI